MRHLILAAFCVATATPLVAGDVTRIQSSGDVATTMDRLVAAVEGAGAKVFARVNHGAGAESVNMPIGASELLIFGNPALGTPALQADALAGLYLPLRVLAYADAEGVVWLAYENPVSTFEDLTIESDSEVLKKMSGALAKLTAAAASGG